MKISGFKGFYEALPDYTEKETRRLILRLPLFAIFALFFQVFILYFVQWLSRTSHLLGLETIEIMIPILLNLVFVLGGTIVAQQGFLKKNQLVNTYGAYGYQKIVKTILLGISMVFAGDLFAYLPIFYSSSSKALILSSPFDSSILGGYLSILRYILGFAILIIAVLAAFRAIQEFGIDSASMVYVYFPEKAKVVDHEIYSIVRHPMYLAVILISIGGFIVNFSFYGLIHLMITLLGFYRHIFHVEEKELIERFGDSYDEYSKKTPAIFIHPKNWGKFFKFLLKSKK